MPKGLSALGLGCTLLLSSNTFAQVAGDATDPTEEDATNETEERTDEAQEPVCVGPNATLAAIRAAAVAACARTGQAAAVCVPAVCFYAAVWVDAGCPAPLHVIEWPYHH